MCCVFNLYYQPSAAAARQQPKTQWTRAHSNALEIDSSRTREKIEEKEKKRKRSRLTRLNWNLCGSSSSSWCLGRRGFFFPAERESPVRRFCRVQVTPVSKIEFGSSFLSFRFVSLSVGWSWCWCCGCCVTVDRLTDWLSYTAQWKKNASKKAGTHQKLIGLPASLSLSLYPSL